MRRGSIQSENPRGGQYSIQGEKPRAVSVFRMRSKEMIHSNVTSKEMQKQGGVAVFRMRSQEVWQYSG
jgi:hypothetical protein